MQKKVLYTMVLSAMLACVCFSGCNRLKAEPRPSPAEFTAGTVEPTVQTVTMVLSDGETAKLDALENLVAADLRGSECYEEIYAWATAHPDVAVRYTVPLPNGNTVTNEIAALDMTGLEHSGVEQLIRAAACLPKLSRIELGTSRPNFSWEDVAQIVEAFPTLSINYTGELYGKQVPLDTTTLDLKFIPIEDGGELVRTVLRCLPKLEYLDMDSCGLSNEEMAALRDEHPDIKVVWRIWFGDSYSVRTDVEKILASKPSVGGMLTPENCGSLIYCTDVKYLDLGHNDYLTDISFVSYMPKLEVCILAMDYWSDATPLASCPELEYLEVQTTKLNDLSPLAGLSKLEHLNICNLSGEVDLTPLYGLTKLERLWIGGYTHVDKAQVEKLQELLPDCEINTSAGDPTEGHWRYVDLNLDTWQFILHPRYQELQHQFGYYDGDYSFYWNDPIYTEVNGR